MVRPVPATPKRPSLPGLIILIAGCATLMAGCATTAPPSVTAEAPPPPPLSARPVPHAGPRPPAPRPPLPRESMSVKPVSPGKPAPPMQGPTAQAARAPQPPAAVRPATPAVASPPTPPAASPATPSMPSPAVPKAVGIRLLWPVHGKATDVTLGDSRDVVALAIAAAPDSPVAAAAAGKVVFVGPVRGKGNVVVIRHSATLMTIYGQLQPITAVVPGTGVRAGDRIGTIAPGETAAHLHFELRDTGRAVNPRAYF